MICLATIDRDRRGREQIAALGNRFDRSLGLVLEGLPDILDALDQRIFGDVDVLPDVVDQFRFI